jgi:agmatine/peptidylarginine deiminase
MFSKKPIFRVVIFLIFIVPISLMSQNNEHSDLKQKTEDWFEKHPYSYPHWLTPEEELHHNANREFYETDPPVGLIINVPEFAPMEGVLIRYPFGISYTVIAEMSENTVVTTIVSSTGQQNYVINQYNSNGVNLNNCNFLIAGSNSYWTRDYGPWYIIDGNDELSIVNFPYNRPRPLDNDIPIEMAEFLGLDLYGMDVETAGGNYMTDGMGVSASSSLIFEENGGQSQMQIRNKFEEYLGIYDYDVIDDPNNTYIDHIDCWAKYLDVDKILIRSVPQSHSQYDEIEEVVDYFESQITGYGTSYEIYRVYTPQNQPYTNSLILNEKVLVPVTGSSWDDDALEVYEEAMPGYEVIGVTGGWESTDALHCRTKGIADRNMVYISHTPVFGDVEPMDGGIEISATLIPLDSENLSETFAEIRYKFNNSTYQSTELEWDTGNEFIGMISPCSGDCEVSYYIRTLNSSGTVYNHPYIGEPDPHMFNMINPDVQITVGYSEDWNLVGNPVNTSDNQVNDLFPSSTENTLYSFGSTGYMPQSELEPGIGYWLHFQDDGMASMSGLPIYEHSLNLNEGWNLVSGLSIEISITQIDDPFSILIPNTVYGYELGSGYINSDLIQPGKGYWLRTNSDGLIILNVIAGKMSEFFNRTRDADWISINGVKLFLDLSIPEVDQLSYTLPPKPIEGSQDIRFMGDVIFCGNYGVIEVQSNHEFLMLEYSISNPGHQWNLMDDKTKTPIVLAGNGETLIKNSPELILNKQSIIPNKISLHSNNPNPFNHSTTISFELYKEEFISLDIYDASGKHITNLKNGQLNKGIHSMVWNGNNSSGNTIPSGIYFYTLSFENRKISNKMLLLK